jgi:glutamyl-tRNA synthetase
MIKTRFAPSPTGYLHIGNLRTVLFEYLFAKHNNGLFVVRVEDTDQERLVPGAMESMLKTLAWVGIVPDEGPRLGENGKIVEKGSHGPYVQSKRLDIYKKYVEQLLESGNAYYAFDTAEELTAMREKQQAQKLPTRYDRARMRNQFTIEPTELEELLASDAPRVVRLKVPDNGEVSFDDLVYGCTVVNCKEVDDQVLLKSDGFPTYHLAVVVDDHLMEITHIIRGDDWISSTPKHLLLYKAFGWTPPTHAHVPNVIGSDKLKLSKRKGDVSTESYRQKGYLPEALVNFLAFLGWNPGTEKEIYSMGELIADFSLDKVSKAGAVFNVDKLNWYNKQYLKSLSNPELVEKAKPWLEEAGIPNSVLLTEAVGLERERITTLSELPQAIKFVFELPNYNAEMLVWKKSSKEEVFKILPELSEFVGSLDEINWNKGDLEVKIKNWITEKGYATGSVMWPMRVALSGQENSPGPFEIAEVLGKQEAIKRLQSGVSKLV